MRLIVDTDAGPDDLIALAFLLSRNDLAIEAVTLSYGLADPRMGAENVAKLLSLADRPDIPVFVGDDQPTLGTHAFPEDWRRVSNELPGVNLPPARRAPQRQPAASFLAERLRDQTRPVRILTLGGLTNIATVLKREPSCVAGIEEIVIMGGAFGVPGNVTEFRASSADAEWNLFVDAGAARIVLESEAGLLFIPLDATNRVLIDARFVSRLRAQPFLTALGRFVGEVLEGLRPYIDKGSYYAWDPLAAAAIADPGIVRTRSEFVSIGAEPPHSGKTGVISQGHKQVLVAVDADAARFARTFFRAFQQTQPSCPR